MLSVAQLRQPPFNLDYGSGIYARVAAINEYGIGPLSDESRGTILATIPDAPTGITEKEALRTPNQIGLTWVAPNFTGGVEILDYRI